MEVVVYVISMQYANMGNHMYVDEVDFSISSNAVAVVFKLDSNGFGVF